MFLFGGSVYLYLFRWPVVRLSVDGRLTPPMSPDCRLIDGRYQTEVFIRAVHIFNVNARRRPIWESRTWTLKTLIARSEISMWARHYSYILPVSDTIDIDGDVIIPESDISDVDSALSASALSEDDVAADLQGLAANFGLDQTIVRLGYCFTPYQRPWL